MRAVFAAFSRGDREDVFKLYDGACVIRVAPTLPWAGEFVCTDGVRNLLGMIRAQLDLTSRIVEIYANSSSSVVRPDRDESTIEGTGERIAIAGRGANAHWRRANRRACPLLLGHATSSTNRRVRNC